MIFGDRKVETKQKGGNFTPKNRIKTQPEKQNKKPFYPPTERQIINQKSKINKVISSSKYHKNSKTDISGKYAGKLVSIEGFKQGLSEVLVLKLTPDGV